MFVDMNAPSVDVSGAVFGCGDFDPPEGASLQRSGEDAVVVCNKTFLGTCWDAEP